MPDQAISAANNNRRFIVSTSHMALQRARTSFSGPDANRLAKLRHKYFPITDLAGARRFDDGFHHSIHLVVIDREFELYLG
jgi:hypothetical protein